MSSGEETVLYPWLRGFCEFHHLNDGTLSLADVLTMNDAIRVRDENMRRAEAAREK